MEKIKTEDPAVLERLFPKGGNIGPVANRLLQAGMNVNTLRTNTTLRKDEWKEIDDTVVQISRQRLVGVGDLISRGLNYPLKNALKQNIAYRWNLCTGQSTQ